MNIILPIQLCIVYTYGTQWCWIKLPKGKARALGFKNNSRNKVFLHKQLLYIVYISISNDIGDIHGRWSQSVNTVNNGSGIWFRWERRLLSELLQTLPGDILSQSCLLVYFCTSSCSPVWMHKSHAYNFDAMTCWFWEDIPREIPAPPCLDWAQGCKDEESGHPTRPIQCGLQPTCP